MTPDPDHGSLRLVALGGLGEFGLNALLLECEDERLLVDAGALFATAELPGVEQTDVESLSAWGDRGVLVLLSDSTNVEMRGRTGGEDEVMPAFEEVFASTRGRVLVSCFATSVPRIQRAARAALAAGRSIAFVGRRMADNADVAMQLGLLDIPPASVLPLTALPDYPAGGLCLFVSGSQGEPFS